MAFAARLESLEQKHKDLKLTIDSLEKLPQPDEIFLKKLKVEKLSVKDRIAQINQELSQIAAE